MDAEIKDVWIIAQCPHCKSPFTKKRFVYKNEIAVYPMLVECEFCSKSSTIDLKIKRESVDFR